MTEKLRALAESKARELMIRPAIEFGDVDEISFKIVPEKDGWEQVTESSHCEALAKALIKACEVIEMYEAHIRQCSKDADIEWVELYSERMLKEAQEKLNEVGGG